MAGRKKLPIQLHEARGNPSRLTKEEIEKRKKNQVANPPSELIVPSYLTAKQKREFEEYAKQLIDLDIYSDLDRETLAAYIVAVDEWQFYTKKIRAIKITTKMTDEETLFALEKRKSFALERDRVHKVLKGSASDLGLTITSRCKLVIPKVEEPEENKFNKFMKTGG